MVKNSKPHALEQASKDDPVIFKFRHAILNNDWTCFKGTAFHTVKDELWTAGQMLMRGNRIVLPELLREHEAESGHKRHQGIVGTKNRLRSKVWWPEIDKMVERKVKKCYPCQVIGKNAPPEELEGTPPTKHP